MAEKEYIEREAALEECDWYANEFCECDYAIMPLKGELENLPAADVRPNVRGEWISPDGISTCSVCGKAAPFDVEADIIVYWPNLNFCPNCGAKMEKS